MNKYGKRGPKSMDRIRDKTYLRIDNDMLFNVVGDHHPDDRFYSSLKYVNGCKWTAGYLSATRFLKSEEPTFIDNQGYIAVPRTRIAEVFDPFLRWQVLVDSPEARGPLHTEALVLAECIRTATGVSDFGITDSLLWGNGTIDSDVDLVIRGRDNAKLLMELGQGIFKLPGFARPSPHEMKAPYGLDVPAWSDLLLRKSHMGLFHGRRFSIRCVLDEPEIEEERNWELHEREVTKSFVVSDRVDSLLFPAVYRDSREIELLDYSVVYEGVFRVGDRVDCECDHLSSSDELGKIRHRFVMTRLTGFTSAKQNGD